MKKPIKISKLPDIVKLCSFHPSIKMNAFTYELLRKQGFEISVAVPYEGRDQYEVLARVQIFDKNLILSTLLEDLEICMIGSDRVPAIRFHIIPQEFVVVKILSVPTHPDHGQDYIPLWVTQNYHKSFNATIEVNPDVWRCGKIYRIQDADMQICVCEHWIQEVDEEGPLPVRRIKT